MRRTFPYVFSFLLCLSFHSSSASKDLIGPPYCPKTYIGETISKDSKAARCYGFPLKNPKAVATWVDAQKDCKDQKGFLGTISDPKEAARLLKYIRQEALKKGINSIWVAANDAFKLNEFKWLDGAPLMPQGQVKYDESYPTKHETPNCIYLVFHEKDEIIKVKDAPCFADKKHYICQMPMFAPGKDGKSKNGVRKVAGSKKKKKRRKGKRRGSKGKAPSMNTVNAAFPQGIPGAAAINSISADKLINARGQLIMDMYGSAIIADEEMAKMLPPEISTANLSDSSLASTKAILTEMTGDYFQQFRRSNATEIAKGLTSTMLEEGRSIRCVYGVGELQRQVECVGSNGIIDSCIRATSLDGKVVRDCGLPGLAMHGCHTTMQGVVCFCEKDLCNKASGLTSSWIHRLIIAYTIGLSFRMLL